MSNTCETCDTYVCDHIEEQLDNASDLMNEAADMLDDLRGILTQFEPVVMATDIVSSGETLYRRVSR